MNEVNVSIVIPMYNQKPNYLKECLESAIKQTYPKDKYEIIIVNDGSNDIETLAELNEWRNKPNIKIIDKENGGTASALNAGIKAMSGEWFMWLSSDDIWFTDKIEAQMKFMENKKEGKIFYSDWIRINASGEHVYNEIEPVFESKEEMIEHLCFRFFGCGSTIMIHKSCFDKVGLFNENLKLCEDYEMWFRLAKEFMFYKVPYKLMKYRTHAGMLSTSSDSHQAYLKIVEWGRKYVDFNEMVSVIIPVFNEEKTIKKCIESIMKEPNVNEIIVVDDTSTDKTAEIVKSIKESTCEITLLTLTNNMGRSYARTVGIKKSRNNLICTVDGDIVLDNGWLTHLLQAAVWYGGMDATAGSVRWIYDRSFPFAEEISAIMTNIGKRAIGTAVTLFRKRILEKVPFDVNMRDGEDSDLFLRLEKGGYLFYKDTELIGKHVANMDLMEFLKRNYEYGQHKALLWVRHKDVMTGIALDEFNMDAKTLINILDNLRVGVAMLGFKDALKKLEIQVKFPKWREHK